MLEYKVEQHRTTVSGALASELDAIASAIPGFAAALAWPDGSRAGGLLNHRQTHPPAPNRLSSWWHPQQSAGRMTSLPFSVPATGTRKAESPPDPPPPGYTSSSARLHPRLLRHRHRRKGDLPHLGKVRINSLAIHEEQIPQCLQSIHRVRENRTRSICHLANTVSNAGA
jgi:hypothetical protein